MTRRGIWEQRELEMREKQRKIRRQQRSAAQPKNAHKTIEKFWNAIALGNAREAEILLRRYHNGG